MVFLSLFSNTSPGAVAIMYYLPSRCFMVVLMPVRASSNEISLR
jgi:hypothetical protein